MGELGSPVDQPAWLLRSISPELHRVHTDNTSAHQPNTAMKLLLKIAAPALSLAMLLVGPCVWVWGAQGHQVIAELAWAQLSPLTRSEVKRLLALEPGETMASISSWADEHHNPTTAPDSM